MRRVNTAPVAAMVGLLLTGLLAAIPAAEASVTVSSQDVPGTDRLYSIACPTASTCYAVGSHWELYLGDQGVIVTISNGIPGTPQPVPGTGAVWGIVCPTPTLCYAVAGHGKIVTITNGIPSTPKDAGLGDMFVLTSLACATSSVCYAVGNDSELIHGVIIPITNGTPGVAVPNESVLIDIACLSTRTCYAVGAAYGGAALVPITDGAMMTTQVLPAVPALNAIACPGNTCYAVASVGDSSLLSPRPSVVVPIVDGTFGAPHDSNGAWAIIGCAAGTNACVAVGDDTVQITNGIAGTVLPKPGILDVHGIACPDGLICFGVGELFTSSLGPQGLLWSFSLDTTPPVLNLPGNIIVDATGPGGAAVLFSVTATDPDDTLTPTCAPASGSQFPIGTTTVNCSVIDAGGNTASGSFTVTVKDASEQLLDLLTTVRTIAGLGSSFAAKVEAALNALQSGQTAVACSTLQALLNEVQAQSGKHLMTADATALMAEVNRIRSVIGC